ncbi:MAG: hypothetical protein ABSA63_04950 [Thermoplasmata archaeon]
MAVELKNLDSLFDSDATRTYPHTESMVNKSVAKFLLDSVRLDRRKPKVELTLAFRSPPLAPDEEERVRAQLSRYFAIESKLAVLDLSVNRTEGVGSLRFAIPVVIVAGLVAGYLSLNTSLLGPSYLTALAYLIVITIVWVMLWDPIEKLLYDSYLIRLRVFALRKLAAAKITFVYRPTSQRDGEPARKDPL